MTLLTRLRAAWARFCASLARTWGRLKARIQGRPEPTEGQLAQERETATSLGLMAQAAAAGADMTDEQAIFLSASKTGMRNRIGVLMGIPHRSLAQERELVMIERELARLEGRDDAPAIRPLMGEQPGILSRIMASLIPFFPYILIGGLLLSVTGWGTGIWNGMRADRAEHQRDHFRDIAQNNYDQWEIQKRLATDRLEALTAAQQLSQATADALTAERERVARAAARERRRNREIANVLAHSPDAPAWRLRDDGSDPADSSAEPTGR